MAKYYIVCMALIWMAVVMGASPAAGALSCGQVATYVAPCITYLRSGGQIPGGCCSGVKSLNSAASSTAERQNVCSCLISAASSIPNLNANLVASLPSTCGVSLSFKISSSTNCKSIK